MRILVPILWFSLAAWFLFGSPSSRADVLGHVPSTPDVPQESIDPLDLRSTFEGPPRVKIGGVMQKCSDCHDVFASLDVTPSNVRQHDHIELDHGINDRCFNCHSQANRNLLVLRDGSEIELADSIQLCSQCHGTVYRDWERGMHGRTTGSWDRESDQHGRLGCAQCHDPHAPAFDPIVPLPGPRTWRMPTERVQHVDDSWRKNPLERWKRSSRPAATNSNEH